MASSTLTFDDLKVKVRRQLQDAEGNYWSDAEIDDYLNEGQLEYARKTRALRGKAPITVKVNNETYRLPDDCLEVLRLEDSDGNEIPRATSDEIQRVQGNFRNRTNGVPASPSTSARYAYSDLDGQGLIQFSPSVNPTIEESIIKCQPYTRFGFTTPTSNDRRIRIFEDGYLYLADTTKIYRYSILDEYFLEIQAETWNHTLSVWPDFQKVPTNKNDSRSGYFFFIQENGSDIISVSSGFGQTISTFGTSASGTIKSLGIIIPPTTGFSSVLVYLAGTSIVRTSTGTFFESVVKTGITSVTQWAYDEPTRTIYAATSQGLFSMELTAYSMTTITTIPATGVCVLSGSVYVTLQGYSKIFKVTGSVLVDEVSSDLINTSGIQIISDKISRVLLWGYNGWGVVYDVVLGEIITTKTALDDLIMFAPGVWGDTDGYGGRFYQRITGDQVNYSDDDAGILCAINEIVEHPEQGSFFDIQSAEEDDIINIVSDAGELCQIVQSFSGVQCYYVRSAIIGEVEISDSVALIHYALYKCYEKDGDKTAMERAMYHMGQFQIILRRDLRRAAQGFSNARPAVQGYHF